jgi:hypothetical protein
VNRPEFRSVDQGLWLAEVDEALAGARKLLQEAKFDGGDLRIAADLYVSVEAALLEIRSLRLSYARAPIRAADLEGRVLGTWVGEPSRKHMV